MSLAEKKNKRTYPTKDVTICLDAALSAERDRLMARQAQPSDDRVRSGKASIAKEIAALEDRMRDSLLTIRVTGTDYATYNSVQFAHKPRKGRMEAFNPTTFFTDIVYKTSYEVDGDELVALRDQPRGDWDEIANGLTDAEFTELANAVIATNGVRAATGFLDRNASGTTPDSSETSGSPETSE